MSPPDWLAVLGGLVLAGVLLGSALVAADRVGLAERHGTAVVVGKEHRPAGRTHVTQVVDNRALVVPQTTPEMHVLRLDLGGAPVEAAVDRAVYGTVAPGDRVRVTYQRRRLTGTFQVVRVAR